MLYEVITAICAQRQINGKEPIEPDDTTVLGAIIKYTTCPATEVLKPMNANFGIMAPLDKKIKNKNDKALAYAKRAMESIERMKAEINVQ